MRYHFLVALLLIVASLAVVGPASAQEVTVNTTNATSTTTEEPDCAERIDARTRLCSAEVHGGTAQLTFKSDGRQTVTLTDAGGFFNRGPITQKTAVLEDGRTTVEIEITLADGVAGVSVDTGSVLYAVPLEYQSSLIGGPWTVDDVRLSALAAGVSVLLVSILVTVRTITGRTQEPERIA